MWHDVCLIRPECARFLRSCSRSAPSRPAFACTARDDGDGASAEDAITKPATRRRRGSTRARVRRSSRRASSRRSRVTRSASRGCSRPAFDVETLPAVRRACDGGQSDPRARRLSDRDGQAGQREVETTSRRVRPPQRAPVPPERSRRRRQEHWGGFPFLNYHEHGASRCHGPIGLVEDFDAGPQSHQDWRLVRERISLGCNRMQGEHILELTHCSAST